MTQEDGASAQGTLPVECVTAWMRRNGVTCVAAFLLVYLAVAARYQSWNPFLGRTLALSFDGDSAKLIRTQIVPTLDTPIEPGKNVVWCATFAAGWKQLQRNVTHGPVSVAGAAEVCARLNTAPDPAPSMPSEAFYAAAGTVEKGIIKTIHEDMMVRFPSRNTPDFGRIPGMSFVLYSYLEARVPFTLVYLNNPKRLEFTGSRGEKTAIRSFGFGKADHMRNGLMEQPEVLMAQWDETAGHNGSAAPVSFAVDLCKNTKPYQIVVARVPKKESLGATLSALNQDIAAFKAQGRPESIYGGILRVPYLFWRVSHHYWELEGRPIENAELQGQIVGDALQEIQFRLDRTGAEVASEAKANAAEAKPVHEPNYVLDGPFLLYITKRGAGDPFFVVWIDNAELLQRWGIGSVGGAGVETAPNQ